MGLAESRPTLRWSALVSSTPRLVIAWRRDTLHPARLRCLTEPTVDRCSDASTGFVEACHPPKEYGMICSLCTFNYARLYIVTTCGQARMFLDQGALFEDEPKST